MPSFTLAEYVNLIANVPPPTQQQKENFAEFVAHAHSWYKHLPSWLPGAEFFFFIDKYAGCDRVVMGDGTAAIAERKKRGFHYSDIPTDQYRARFGHLAFSCGYGTTVYLAGKGPVVMPRDGALAVLGDDAELYDLPPQIVEAGVALLTAVIHTHSGAPGWIQRPRGEVEWPQESGGQAVVEKIFARWREMEEPTFEPEKNRIDESLVLSNPHLFFVDRVLHELLTPERRRQYREIVKAIDRVCEVIDGQRRTNTRRI